MEVDQNEYQTGWIEDGNELNNPVIYFQMIEIIHLCCGNKKTGT